MTERRHVAPRPATTSTFDRSAWGDAPLSGTHHVAVLFAETDFTDVVERGASFTDCTFREVRFSGSSHVD
ncbi:MAG: pentapeptide repeat-containing protein, partial [Chloroflexota bacterium]